MDTRRGRARGCRGPQAAGPAAADGASQVDGIQTLVDIGDPFDPADDVSAMDGYGGGRPALIGLWYTRTFVVGVVTPSGVVTATGTEEFVGCLDSNGDRSCGRVGALGDARAHLHVLRQVRPGDVRDTARTLPPSDHGGTGDFDGATGVLHFKEDPDAGCSYYAGHLTLGG